MKLTQNPYTLVVMMELIKNLFPLAGKTCFYSQEYLQKSKKMVSMSRNNVLLSKLAYISFHEWCPLAEKALNKSKRFVINQKPFPLARMKD